MIREQKAIEQFRQEREGNEPRILKDKYGSAGEDGYTCIARRVRGDQPGEVMDEADADAMEKMQGDYGDGHLTPYPF